MFWLHEEDLPAGVGSEQFSAMHLVYIAFFLAVTVWYAFFYKKTDLRRRIKADRIVGSLVFFFGLCEYGITALVGHFTLYTLPIHVCSLNFTLCLIHAWTNAARPGSFAAKLHRFLGAVIFHPGMLGALAALIFPDWLYYPYWNYLNISGFMAHGLICVYGVSIIINHTEVPDRLRVFLRDLLNSLLYISIGAVVMRLFDNATGTNYWFMAEPSYSSPLVGIYERGGYSAYLLAYILTTAVFTVLWYGLRFLLLVRRSSARPDTSRCSLR